MVNELLMIFVGVIAFLAFLIELSTGYWKKRGIPCKQAFPLIGHMAPFMLRKKSAQELFKGYYNSFPRERYAGYYFFLTPALLIRDPDLVKQITIKHFDCFTDHAFFRPIKKVDPVLSEALVGLKGQNWKALRTTLSPSYTSNKMKFIFSLLIEGAEDFTKYFENRGGIVEVDMTDVFTRITIDFVATAAFGIKVDSLNVPDNQFYNMGKGLLNVRGIRAVRLAMYVAFPKLMEFLNIPALPLKFSKYFAKLIQDIMEERVKSNITRPDMVQMFIESKKENAKLNLSFESMVAQAMMFFTAGALNTTAIMAILSYELTKNPSIQKRLQNEVDETLNEWSGKLTYDALFGMKYLDMVLSETMRKWPAGPVLDRLSVEEFEIKPSLPHETVKVIEKGTMVLIPFGAMHHDPQYFPDPSTFDPERFSNKNKSNIIPGTYMPFGIGPRNCISQRFALMEIKIVFFYMLSKFNIVETENTPKSLTEQKLRLNLGFEEKFLMGLQQR